MRQILFAWIGATDLKSLTVKDNNESGPVAQAISFRAWDEIVLLSNYPSERITGYVDKLQYDSNIQISVFDVALSSPTNFEEIYRATCSIIQQKRNDVGPDPEFTFHLSPGTPAMAAVWIILSKTKFPSGLIESSRDHGVKSVSFPFDLAVEFLPDELNDSSKKIKDLASGILKDEKAFQDIIYRSNVMKRVVLRARLAAQYSIPVLIEGESGTGKELFARAIHNESPRKDEPFVSINCGAIPKDLIESELFGYEKGAFTGASTSKRGHFEAADRGTLFLDEIGELPIGQQVRLLRVLQEGELKRLGATDHMQIDVRVIAATNKNLVQAINEGQFREDLFYRLAVAVLKLPPLRERSGDIGLLIDTFQHRINKDFENISNYVHKEISVSARNFMIGYGWPGNVRELINTLTRASVYSLENIINIKDIRESILVKRRQEKSPETMLGQPVARGVDLPKIMQTVASHYLREGLKEVNGNKTKASKLLGLPSYQTLTNWLRKYGVE